MKCQLCEINDVNETYNYYKCSDFYLRHNLIACGECGVELFNELYSSNSYFIKDGYPNFSNDDYVKQIIEKIRINGTLFPKYYTQVIDAVLSKIKSKDIVNANQVCSSCKKSAPHGKTNDAGEFVCITCQLMQEF